MATVTGLTAEKTMALLAGKANVAHTHDGGSSGGSSSQLLGEGYTADSFNYLSPAGEGTELKPASWVEVESNSYSSNGVLGFPNPRLTYIDPSDNRLYVRTPGIYQVRVSWYVAFPNSSPTSFASFVDNRELDPAVVAYHPVGPSRPLTYQIEGHYADTPHASGESLTPPLYFDEDWWVCSPALWWNTQDAEVVGGTYIPGSPPGTLLPTLSVLILKVG